MITKFISSYIIVLFAILLVSSISYTKAQEGEWSTPIPITDSLTNNSNPVMIRITHRDFVFYEKQTSENSYSIFMRNITEMSEAIEVLNQENVSFRNPQIIKFSGYPNDPDTLFYLVFESDLTTNGIFNIYYSKYSQDGNFSAPESLEIGYTSCQDLKIMGRNLVWERGGNIETTYLDGNSSNYYFHPIMTIDEGGCSNPCISESEIIYLKEINDENNIYRSTWNYPLGEWHESIGFFDGINSSLSILTLDITEEVVFLWESLGNGIWKPYAYDVMGEEIESLELFSETKTTPDAVLFDVIIKKKKKDIWFNYFAYTFNDNENSDIFVNNLWSGYQYCFNISQSSAIDSKPRLFYLPSDYLYTTYLTFQSERNNKQQLFMSKVSFWLGENELANHNNSLTISPNPITHQTQIITTLSSAENLKIEIYSSTGVLIETHPLKNTQTTIWTPSKDLKNGVYIINLKSDLESIRKKVILQR
ncbi:T9SS type A sorting domain-containing protein [Lentimicrobium sp. S6]|uniref:T9SS type A sorting domain-containing protein n=1 Tax=Lentimicrobium sp. S6 TaxID=2735872 RepID=UPI0015519608|nr:T9SS type A sorting domain-containing protein [Lentimicrobium sp. S6]NPD47066.1 T9SS type A sorting domain-containing protein [Lentimicrobium sp. S6]